MSPHPHPLMAQLRELRLDANRSQATIASRIGVSRYTVTQWETGRRSPRIPDVVAYASALGYTISLTKDGEPS